MIHATNKSLKDLGDKVSDSEKHEIESAIEALQQAMKGDDKDAIEQKTQALAEQSGKLAERVYKEKTAQDEAAAGEGAATAGGGGNDDVVDAEFEEVKDADSK